MARICLGVGAAAWLIAAVVASPIVRGQRKGMSWVWRGGIFVGGGALVVATVLLALDGTGYQGSALLSTVTGRAGLLAVIAALLTIATGRSWWLGSLDGEGRGKGGKEGLGVSAGTPDAARLPGWPALVLVALVAVVGAVGPSSRTLATMAPLLLLGLLFTTGLVLWSTGQNLTVLAEGKSVSPETAVIVFVGLTLSVATVTGVNWRIWGNPIGTLAASLGLLAVWLIYAARIVLQHKPPWLTSAVELVAVVLLIVIALSVQWDWAL